MKNDLLEQLQTMQKCLDNLKAEFGSGSQELMELKQLLALDI